MRILLLIIFASLFTPTVITAQYQFQTLVEEPVGPGVNYKHITESTQPWSIQVLSVDLGNPYIDIETVKARDKLQGLETTSSMALRSDSIGHYVVGAVNGDFFDNTGTPINAQISGGELLRPPIPPPTIAFDIANLAAIHRVSFQGDIIINGSRQRIHTVNMTRTTDDMVLYNSYRGKTTRTNKWGTEILLQPLQRWLVNDTLLCVAKAREIQTGDMSIPPGKAVLSGHGSAGQFLSSHVDVGDTLQIWLGLSPGLPQLEEMVGGYVQLVKNGKNYVDTSYLNHNKPAFTYVRHPRSAIGYSSNKETLFLVTVDGRQRNSVGMTLPELADFMITLGAYDALNLDGGGSTTMVVRHQIKNSPSDAAGERAVCNALLVIAETPPSPLVDISVAPDSFRVLAGQSVSLQVVARDTFFNPVPLDIEELDISHDHPLGTLSAQGIFTAAASRDSGYIRLAKDGLKDSAFVVVKSIESYKISPSLVVTDTMSTVTFQTRVVDSDGEVHFLTADYSVLDNNIGSVDKDGIFIPFREGETAVVSRYLSYCDTARVKVQLGTDILEIDSIEDMENWSFSHDNCDSNNTKISLSAEAVTAGTSALRLDYSYKYQPRNEYWLYLDTRQSFYGIPDTLLLDIKLDSLRHKIYVFVETATREEFRLFPRPHPENINAFNRVAIPLKPPPGSKRDTFIFPVTITRVAIRLYNDRIEDKIYSGTLYLDNLRAIYPGKTFVASSDLQETAPRSLYLYQNFPNPFNVETTILIDVRCSQSVDVKVYDILGRNVATLFSGMLNRGINKFFFNAEDLSSGVYFLKVDPPLAHPRKMVFTK